MKVLRKNHKDLSEIDKSLSYHLFKLLTPAYHNYPLDKLKQEVLDILDDPKISASEITRKKNILIVDRIKSKTELLMWITNLSLKGSNLSVK